MDSFNLLLKEVMKKPDRAGLQMICAQVEAWESYKPSKVKDKAQRAVAMLHADGTLAAEEDMLRLYRIMAKYSRKLGATKVYEKLDEQGRFICSLKFHLMWAEAYAQSDDLHQFTHVLNLARSRLAEVPAVELEMGFRELADQYFPNADIFNEDETVAALNVGQISDLVEKKKWRRRSSVAVFESRAKGGLKPDSDVNYRSFGPKTKTKLRFELVDRPEDKYVAPSIEELRAAMVADQQMANGDDFLPVPMDITMAHPELSTASSQQCNRKERERSRLSRIVGQILETVEEFDSDILKEGKETDADVTAAPAQVISSSCAPQQSTSQVPMPPSCQSSSATVQAASGDSRRLSDVKVRKEAFVNAKRSEEGGAKEEARLTADEVTLSGAKFSTLGIDKKLDSGIVTSTPARGASNPPTHAEFFAPLNHEIEEELRRMRDEEALSRRSSPSSSQSRINLSDTQESRQESDRGDCEKGAVRSQQTTTGTINPWDRELQREILKRADSSSITHYIDTPCHPISVGDVLTLGAESFDINALISEGSFAKVFKVVGDDGRVMALKHEITPCPWEAYICFELRKRLQEDDSFALNGIMQVTGSHMFSNASLLLAEYHGNGTLLDLSNKMGEPSWFIILLIAIQLAKILEIVHDANIIHGNVTPENILILNTLSESCDDVRSILSTPILQLIDWRSAIDMRALHGQHFTGRAGNGHFDCSEMLDGRPWTYQCDYFGFAGTLHCIIFMKNPEVVKEDNTFRFQCRMRRPRAGFINDLQRLTEKMLPKALIARLVVRPLLEDIFHDFLNIPDCFHLPDWGHTIKKMEEQFISGFTMSEWRQSVEQFNSCI